MGLPIKEVRSGDLAWCRSDEGPDHSGSWQKTVRTTGEQPFWVIDKGVDLGDVIQAVARPLRLHSVDDDAPRTRLHIPPSATASGRSA